MQTKPYLRLAAALVCGCLIATLSACRWLPKSDQERIKRAELATDDIVIGVVDSDRNRSLYQEGVSLASEEINQRGGILGRKLRILFADDQGHADKGKKIAQQFAANPDVVAVIGHLDSVVAIPASIIYEKHGIVFITPGATDPNLTLYAREFTFRTIPNDETMGRRIAEFLRDYETIGRQIAEFLRTQRMQFDETGVQMGPQIAEFLRTQGVQFDETMGPQIAEFLRTQGVQFDETMGPQIAEFLRTLGVKNIGVIYERNDKARRWADVFHAQAATLNMTVPAARSYFPTQTDFREVLSELKQKHTLDQLFIVGDLPSAGLLIKQVRDMGLEVTVPDSEGKPERVPIPIIGTDSLDLSELLTVAGKAAEGVVIPTVFDPTQPNKLTREFVKQFTTTYGVAPDTWAALGYDAIQLFAATLERSGTAVPRVISTTLRFFGEWRRANATG